jgi:hypothetical protein
MVNNVYISSTELPLRLELDSGSNLNMSLISTNIHLEEGTRLFFSGWEDGVIDSDRVVDVIDNRNFTALFDVQYLLAYESGFGNSSFQEWYDADSLVNISLERAEISGDGERRVLVSLGGDFQGNESSSLILMDSPKLIEAVWKTQYLIKIISEFGEAFGEGYYDEGSEVEFGVHPGVVSKYFGVINYKFEGWKGSISSDELSTVLIVDDQKIVEAEWKREINIAMVGFVVILVVLVLYIVRGRYIMLD